MSDSLKVAIVTIIIAAAVVWMMWPRDEGE